MHRLELVLAILDANEGTVRNRTVLQKLGYFATLKAGLDGFDYKDTFMARSAKIWPWASRIRAPPCS